MSERKSPSEERATDYGRQRRFAGENPHRFRRSWPAKKQLRNQHYRRLVERSISRALAAAEELDEVAPATVRRRKSTWSSWGWTGNRFRTASLGEWIAWKQRARIERTAWNYFKGSYDSERDRTSFGRFLASLVTGRSEYSCQLALWFGQILEGTEPTWVRGPLRNFSYVADFLNSFGRVSKRRPSHGRAASRLDSLGRGQLETAGSRLRTSFCGVATGRQLQSFWPSTGRVKRPKPKSVTRQFSCGSFCTLVVDQRFASGGSSDQRRDGRIVQRAWQTQANFVEASGGVVGELSRVPDYAEAQGGLNCWGRGLVGIIRGSREKPAVYRAGGIVLAPQRTAGQSELVRAP